jgi:predicted signal transduction protein with EAL and GGDEF domain
MDVTCSIGIARFPEHGEDANALVRAADVAMYNAKRTKGGFSVYDSSHDERRQEFLTLLGELRKAVETDQLVLHFQPKVNLAENRVTGVEALVRWQHPERGFVPPNDFIPFAEQTGYISAITEWVLKHAIEQCGLWHRTGLSLKVSVNVSARDLRQEDVLVKLVDEALRASELPAGLLCLEITESGLMEDPRSAQSTLRKLRDLGSRPPSTTTGPATSSLSYIKQLAVNELKIDRTFVSGMEADQQQRRDRALDHRARPQPGPQRGRRGRGDRPRAGGAAPVWLRSRPGLLLLAPDGGSDFEAWLVKQPGYAALRLTRVGGG